MAAQWTLIQNPKAASGKYAHKGDEIRAELKARGIQLQSYQITDQPGHAIELAKSAVENGARNIIAMGGDGTLNEVANGILRHDLSQKEVIVLAQLPTGTGNDWGRSMAIPRQLEAAMDLLKNGSVIRQDVGRVEWGNGESRYFINVAGMGYDAAVGEAVNRKKAQGNAGVVSYVSALLGCLGKYKSQPTSIQVGKDPVLNRSVFSLAVGIHRYNGGGMMICPEAQHDDGAFDLTVIGEISKMAVIRNVPRLFNGRFVKHPAVSQFRSDRIRIECPEIMQLEVDGEVIGAGDCTFTCLPRALSVLSGK